MRASSALARGPLRRSAPPPRRGAAGRRRARPCQRPDRAARVAHAPCLAGPGVRRGGEVARSAGRGPGDRMGVWEFRLPTLERSAEPVGRGALPAGIVPPLQDAVRDAWCASRLRGGLPRRAPGGRGRIRRARGPCGFLLPAGTFPPDPPARPPRARIQDALPTPRGRDGLCARPEGRVQLRVRRQLIRCGASVWMLRGGCASALVAPGTAGGRRPRAPVPSSGRCGGLLRVDCGRSLTGEVVHL